MLQWIPLLLLWSIGIITGKVYYYPMNEQIGSTVLGEDGISIAIYKGRNINIPTLVPGIEDSALYLGKEEWGNLGNFRHNCVGTLDYCAGHLKISFWVKFDPDPFDVHYVISSGGQTKVSHGFWVRWADGGLDVGFKMTDGTTWRINDMVTSTWTAWNDIHIEWSKLTGLRYQINDVVIEDKGERSTTNKDHKRLIQLNDPEITDLVIGRPNNVYNYFGILTIDELLIHFDDPTEPELEVTTTATVEEHQLRNITSPDYKPCSDECECFCSIHGSCLEEGYHECERCYCSKKCPRYYCCCRRPRHPCYCSANHPCSCHGAPCRFLGLNVCQNANDIHHCNRLQMWSCCRE